MKCPNCDHVSEKALLKCSSCSEVFDRQTLEELRHIDYLLGWLENRREILGAITTTGLVNEARAQRGAILARLLPEPEPFLEPAPESLPPAFGPEELQQLALHTGVRKLIPGWVRDDAISVSSATGARTSLNVKIDAITTGFTGESPALPDVAEEAVKTHALALLDDWVNAGIIRSQEHAQLLNRLTGAHLQPEPAQPVEVEEVQAAIAEPPRPVRAVQPAPIVRPTPKPPPPPKAPPKPREPLIRWDRLWEQVVESAVSGLLLRWLRYLGAFLFVVSLGIVVVNFWSDIPQWGQVLIIFFIPAAFYGGGWFLRRRLGVVQTGGVLMGVGQVLLAVDFAAIYQFGGLTVPINTYWLISSVICTLVYLLTVGFIIQDEFFGYIGLAGAGSTVMAGAALMTSSVQWPLVALVGFAALCVEISHRFAGGREKWRDLGDAARRFPQIVIPMTLLAMLLIPGDSARPAQAAAFILATAAAGGLAWRFSGWVYTHAAVWLSALAVIFILRALRLDWVWYPTAGAVLSFVYVSLYRLLSPRVQDDLPDRRLHLLAFGAGGVGVLLISLAAGAAAVPIDYWPGVIGLAVSTTALAAFAAMLRRPVLLLAAGALAVVPVSLAAWEWLSPLAQRVDWLMAVWGGLALVYLLAAALLRRSPEYGGWLSLLAHGMAPVTLVAVGGFTAAREYVTNLPILFVLGAALAVYGVSAVMNHNRHPGLAGWTGDLFGAFRSSVFLYPLAALIPVFIAVAWGGSLLTWEWLGPALAGLVLGYIGLGQRLRQIDPAYRLPFTGAAYFVGAAAVLVALAEAVPLMLSLYGGTVGLVLLAWIFRRPVETGAAALLMLWGFGVSMDLLNVLPHAFTLGYQLLAGLVFVPLGVRLQAHAATQRHHYPLLGIGYAVSVLALIVSLAPRAASLADEVPWIGVAVPLLACALYIYSAYTVHPGFTWAAAVVLPLGFWKGLDLLRILPEWRAPAWAGLAIGYLGLWAVLKRAAPEPTEKFNLPLNLGAWSLAWLSLLLTVPDTLAALALGTNAVAAEILLAAIAGQALATGFVVLAAVLYRSRLPLFLEPWLAFFPVTLAFIAFGERLFGAPLTSAQIGIVWAGLGAVHLAVALGLDQRAAVRGALRGQVYGLHLGGYALPLLGILWSLGERASLLWTFGILIAVCAVSAVLVHVKHHPAWETITRGLIEGLNFKAAGVIRDAFIWLVAWMLPVWVVLFLDHLPLAAGYAWLGLPGAALVYLGAAGLFGRLNAGYRMPFQLAAQAAAAVGLLVSVPFTVRTFSGQFDLAVDVLPGLAIIILQSLVVIFYLLFAWQHRRRFLGYLFAYPVAILSFFPYTLGWILSNRLPEMDHYALPWMGLALFWLIAATLLDRQRSLQDGERSLFWAHGPYLVGYGLASFAVFWTLPVLKAASWSFIAVFGVWVAVMAASSIFVQSGRHRSWDDWVDAVFKPDPSLWRSLGRGLFFWLAVWTLPIWVTLLLWQLGVVLSFGYLGYAAAAIVFLAAAVPLRRLDRTFGWALVSAGQFFALLALLLSAGTTARYLGFRRIPAVSVDEALLVLGYVILQFLIAGFWAGSSATFSGRKWAARAFSYLAALLIWVPYSLAWTVFKFGGIEPAAGYGWIELAGGLLLTGFGLDWLERRRPAIPRVGFAHGVYLSGYLGLTCALAWSWPVRQAHLYNFGGVILLALLSHAAVHYRRHDTWADFTGLFTGAGQAVQTVVRTAFLWIAAYAVPIWLAYLLAYHDFPLPSRGLALALAAPIYIAFGLAVRRIDPGATWPLFSAGYLLTAVGAMLTFENQVLAIYVLALDAVIYAVSAYIFRQPVWLYLTTGLTPIIGLLVLEYRLDDLPAEWVAGGFMGLAVAYLVIGRLFDRGRAGGEAVSPFALPFYAPGYLLSAVALAAATDSRELALVVFLMGIGVYTWSAWAFREPVFLYPAVWLAAVPYYLGMTYTRLDPAWYGVGWLPLIAAALAVGKIFFHRKADLREGTHPAMPFYILAYALSVSMVFISRGAPPALTVALSAAAALYLFSARLFRRAGWLYPGLLALHAAVLTAFSFEAVNVPLPYRPVFMLPLTLAMGLLAGRLWAPSATEGAGPWVSLNRDWALPFALFAAIDVVVGGTISLYRWESGIVTAVGHAVLLGMLAWQRVDRRFVWGSIVFFILGLGLRLAWAGLAWPRLGALAAGIGFGLYLTAWTADVLASLLPDRETGQKPHRRLAIWAAPLEAVGIAVNLAGLGIAVVAFVFGAEIAIALAFAGALLLGISYRGRRYEIGYLGVALMEAAFVVVMIGQEVRQPQWYAIPAGLYFVGLGFFERLRGRTGFALLLEGFGLVVLLLTSFVQSLNVEFGFWYFLLLLVETVLVIAWSAQQRRKAPFLIGAGGMLANVVGQIVIVFQGGTDATRWVIFGGLGLLILLAAIFAERWVIPRAQQLRERLEGWS